MIDGIDKYYIVHYPSTWGMGSNTDIGLVTEANLRKIIALEIEKANSGRKHSERFTGTWNNEKMLESDDIERIIDDVIYKRLNTCTTYSGLPDLIELPNCIPIMVLYEKLEDTIFRVSNQWGFIRDIIAGEAYLTRYRVDLSGFTEKVGLNNGPCYEFVEYDLKNVAENHHCDTVESMLEMMKDKVARMESKLKNKPNDYQGHYIDDLFPDMYTPEWYIKEISDTNESIKKFENLSNMVDEYTQHIYKQNYKMFDGIMEKQEKKDKNIDYTRRIYNYPLMPESFACEIINREERSGYLSYEDLFVKGNDIHCLKADLSGVAECIDGFDNDIEMCLVMKNVFGYD